MAWKANFVIQCIACEYMAEFNYFDAGMKAAIAHESLAGPQHEVGIRPARGGSYISTESLRPAQHIGGAMESDYKVCRNRRCRRANIIVGTNQKKCDACGSRLRNCDDPQPGGMDQPPVMITGGSSKPNGHGQLPLLQAGPAVVKQEDTTWQACEDQVKGCPIAKAPFVNVPHAMYREWVYLCERFDVEWIAYLRGRKLPTGEWQIDSYYFPKQHANGAHVDAEGGEVDPQGEPTIGAVHSHVAMKAFFSGEDERHFNHEVELVINRDGDMCANVRMTLECGRPARKDTKVMLIGCPTYDPLVQQLNEKLTKEASSVSTQWKSTSKDSDQTYGHSYQGGYPGWSET